MPWLRVKIQIVPPVNIPIPTKIYSGAPTNQNGILVVLTTTATWPKPHQVERLDWVPSVEPRAKAAARAEHPAVQRGSAGLSFALG